MFVDTHCHLTHELFKQDIDQVVARAKKAGFKALLCSGINRPTNEETLALAKKYDIIKPSLGLYPIDLIGLAPDAVGLSHQKDINLDEELEFIRKHKDVIYAIGEVGLDFHWSTKPEEHELQKKNFQCIIEFTEKLGKPIVVHTRRAEAECIEMLESSHLKHVLLHTFEAKKKLIRKAADTGYFFSVPTSIVRSQQFQLLVSIVDLTQLFTETDAPWLSPFPGKRNEPVHILESIKKISEVKKMQQDDVELQIEKNFDKVFGQV